MRRLLWCLIAALAVASLAAAPQAREEKAKSVRFEKEWSYEQYAAPEVPRPEYMTEAAVDTYLVVYYDFELANWQGWTRFDMTAEIDTFWHVEDYLEPGLASLPGPLQGSKSAWCGAPPAPQDYICSWVRAPGYGNSWDQSLVTDPFPVHGPVTISYRGYFDSEPKYDLTKVQYYSTQIFDWVTLISYDRRNDTVATHTFTAASANTKIRFHFTSDGAWSDEDGLWNTNGAAHIDSITISDASGLVDFEDFESAADNARSCGLWHADVKTPFGKYSGVRSNLQDKDPCFDNITSQIVFFVGSETPSSSYPGLFDTPFCKWIGGADYRCQEERVISPIIGLDRYSTNRDENQDAAIPPAEIPTLGGYILGFTIYRDLPLKNLVFYNWEIRNVPYGCPGHWLDRSFVYYGTDGYNFSRHDISDLVTKDSLQVNLLIRDMCDLWYLVNGDCAEHTPSPWFDNVYIQRYSTEGPQWSYRELDLFQDNFPSEEFDIESYVRADAANDIRPNSDPNIDPGDSLVLDCTSPAGGGLANDGGWPAIYMHVRCRYIGEEPVKPDLAGPSLAGNYGRYKSDDGVWTIIQGDSARTAAGYVSQKYMFDLNDSLFTRGYEIDYYFSALDVSGKSTTLPRYAQAKELFFEWTCLPTLKSDILYVDDFSGRGSFLGAAENYWMPTFDAVFPYGNNVPDKYDVSGPTSEVSNGPGSRAKNYHLTSAYNTIIWDSGDLDHCTISDGTTNSDKSDDCQMLVDWMNISEHECGLWIWGDNVASDLDGPTSAVATELMQTWCGVQLAAYSYFDLTGGVSGGGNMAPYVLGVAGGPFYHASVADSFYAYGGCYPINDFNVLEKMNNGEYALRYPDFGGSPRYAGIRSEQLNSAGYAVKTLWFAFSLQFVRDAALEAPIIRNHILRDGVQWMGQEFNVYISGGDAPAAYALSQCHPNPFNPTTTFSFAMKAKGRVTLKVYSVTGALVRTLVDEVKPAGSYAVTWDGTSDRGGAVASGVYFYKMDTKGFTSTRKMVLLR